MEDIKKILIIRNDHIGDLVLSSAVFRELKKKFPNAKIIIIVSKLNRSVVEKNNYIDEIWELGLAKHNLRSFWEYFKMSWKIKRSKFDVGIDLRGSIMNSFFLLWLSGIKKRISKTDVNPKIKLLLTNPVNIKYKSHITEDNICIIKEGFGINVKDSSPEILTSEQDTEEIKNFLKKENLQNYICLCPYARLENKQWPIDNWKEIIKWFGKFKPEKTLLLMGTKKEENRLNELSNLNKNSRVILNFDLRKMSLLFKDADLVIAQDGGPMHIAWVSGAKLIELHNLFLRWLNKFVPLGNNSHVLYTKNINMGTIGVEDVKNIVRKII